MLFDTLVATGATIVLRMVPFAIASFFTRAIDLSTKAALGFTFAGAGAWCFVLIPDYGDHLRTFAIAYACWSLVAALAAASAARLPQGASLGVRWILALAIAALFILVPSLGEATAGAASLVLIGIDGALSVMSIVLEKDRALTHPQAQFFVLVDPSMSVRARARHEGSPALGGIHVSRFAAGALATGFGVWLTMTWDPTPVLRSLASMVDGTWREPVLRSALAFKLMIGFVASHWGIASLQIAVMRALGYATPERYVSPWVSATPREFWSRWNTYFGTWLRNYVYVPWMEAVRRRTTRPRAHALAVLAVFAVSGAIHWIADLAATRTSRPQLFFVFLAHGVILLAWDSALPRFAATLGSRVDGFLVQSLSRILFLAYMTIAVALVYTT